MNHTHHIRPQLQLAGRLLQVAARVLDLACTMYILRNSKGVGVKGVLPFCVQNENIIFQKM